jgi:superfamily II DNA or RNA helicase
MNETNPSLSSIIDNSDPNTLLNALTRIGAEGEELWIATAFFSLEALMLIADILQGDQRVRILFGDDASPKQRTLLMQQLRMRSDEDLLRQRDVDPLLSRLRLIEPLFQEGKIEARCYTKLKFHAKSYLFLRKIYPFQMGIIGSGNFTRPGLTQNVELNVLLTPEQTQMLSNWYELRWQEAEEDNVTEDLINEIRRQVELYDPWVLYLKALYTWGQAGQASLPDFASALLNKLDTHQLVGYKQSLRIIERQGGVMICDGVGLGKSFIALALMEKFCREGKNVLLIAPKNILNSSWNGYLEAYLSQYRKPFGNIYEMAMTELGFEPDAEDLDRLSDSQKDKYQLVQALTAQADVIVIDESHNFRTTSANRYKNLFRILDSTNSRRKKVIMLTATPVNTFYTDLSAQIALITHDSDSIGGYRIQQIRRFAQQMDNQGRAIDPTGQLGIRFDETDAHLTRVLEQVVIQRSRRTCKELSEATGKHLRFPKRNDPQVVDYEIQHSAHLNMLNIAEGRFKPGVEFLGKVREALELDEEVKTTKALQKLLSEVKSGIRLSAFMTEQYRRATAPGSKQYQDEVRLAGLVYANTLKQLESSLPAFQGIIQSIGEGLIARLSHVCGEEIRSQIEWHYTWIRQPLFPTPDPETDDTYDEEADLSEGEALDASGEETDDWLARTIRHRRLDRKLKDFSADTHDVERWKKEILEDLDYLREIHEAIVEASKAPDSKLEQVQRVVNELLQQGKRVLIFTQSQRTARYLEQILSTSYPLKGVARIDSRVDKTRAAILHAFCPGYNARATAPSVPERIDILISTDVLSEGVNLQEADAIINYDIHWNPVRLIQRIGRVDRRLDPDITPDDREFDIYNVLPPPQIENTINLVGTVEQRTIQISRAIGLDQAFFKANDPAGTLREFNALYEGEVTKMDVALTEYLRHFEEPDPALVSLLEQVPLGAFGVWSGAPVAGLFALFTLQPTLHATEADMQKFGNLEGMPVLILEKEDGTLIRDAGALFEILSQTKAGEKSALPSDETQLEARLKQLRNLARQSFADISLPSTFTLQLVCWMELRKYEIHEDA